MGNTQAPPNPWAAIAAAQEEAARVAREQRAREEEAQRQAIAWELARQEAARQAAAAEAARQAAARAEAARVEAARVAEAARVEAVRRAELQAAKVEADRLAEVARQAALAETARVEAARQALQASTTRATAWSRTIAPITLTSPITTIAGNGSAGRADGFGTATSVNIPCHIAIHPSGWIFFADHSNHLIRRMSPTGLLSTITLNYTAPLTALAGPTGISIQPPGLIGGVGAMYVSQWGGPVLKLTATDNPTTFNCTTFADLPSSIGCAVGNGGLYTARGGAHTIHFTSFSTGLTTLIAGTGAEGYQDGLGKDARFSWPSGIAVHPTTGDIYVSDVHVTHVIRMISRNPPYTVSTYAGVLRGATNIDGPRGSASFPRPYSLCFDPNGNLYVGQDANPPSSVRRIDPQGNVTTVMGPSSNFTDGNGVGNNIRGVAVDSTGNVYFSDGANRMRMIGAAGRFMVPRSSSADNTVQTRGYVGRYVRIRPSVLMGDGYLGLKQVIVTDAAGNNLALNKPSYGTSIYNGAAAQFNVTNGILTNALWHAASGNRVTEFLEIDLGAPVAIASVRLIQNPDATSTNASNDRTTETRIEINADSDSAAAKAEYLRINIANGKFIVPVTHTAENTITTNGFTGRYVRIRPSAERGDGWLEVAQVVVKDSTGTNVALNKPAYATSIHGESRQAPSVTDGNLTPRQYPALVHLGSNDRQAAYLEIDLGSRISISSVYLMTDTGRFHASSAPDRASETRIEIRDTTDAAPRAEYVRLNGLSGRFNMPSPTTSPDVSVATNGYTGRYIRIRPSLNSGDGWINLTQVIVTNAAGTNLALNRPVYATSAYQFGGLPPVGIVNGTSTVQEFPNILHLGDNNKQTQFVEIDLGAPFPIANVRVIGRNGQFGSNDRTSDTRIEINANSDSTAAKAEFARISATVGKFSIPFGATSDNTITTNGYRGRYVRIRPSFAYGDGWLGVAQLIVNDANGNVALNKPVYASTTHPNTPNYPVTNGVLTNPICWVGTGAGGRATEFLEVDLGTSVAISSIRLIQEPTTTSINPTDRTSETRIEINANTDSTAAVMSYAATIASRIRVTTIAGSIAGATDGPGTAAKLNNPCDMVSDSTGNIFVSDSANNLIRRITPSGVVSVFAGSGAAGRADGKGAAASFSFPRGIAIDSANNLYVVDFTTRLLRKITPGQDVTTIPLILQGPHGCAVNSTGTIYVVDRVANKILRVIPDPSGRSFQTTTYAGSGAKGGLDETGPSAQFNAPAGVAVHPTTGNVYISDSDGQRIRMIDSNARVTTVAGTGAVGSANGAALSATFNNPYGLAFDSVGNLYIADVTNNRIRVLTTGGYVTTFTGTAAGATDGMANVATFNSPYGVRVDSFGNVFVADSGNNRIRVIEPPTPSLGPNPIYGKFALPSTGTQTNATLSVNGYTGRYIRIRPSVSLGDGYLGMVQVIASDTDGNNLSLNKPVYVTSTYGGGNAHTVLTNGLTTNTLWNAGTANRATEFLEIDLGAPVAIATIRLVQDAVRNDRNIGTRIEINQVSDSEAAQASYAATNASRMIVTTLTGSQQGYRDGAPLVSGFNSPFDIVFDSAGNGYVADADNTCIRRITPAGIVTTFAGSRNGGGSADGTGTAASFGGVTGLAIDKDNNLYVADRSNRSIRKITPQQVVTTLDRASFNSPTACALDSAGNIYVTDGAGNRVYKMTLSGSTYTTAVFAGSGAAGAADGTGAAATFRSPWGIAIHPITGNIYIGGNDDQKIRMITPAGVVTTVAGGTSGYANGTGSWAKFNYPNGIDFDKGGNLYIADVVNQCIRVMYPSGYVGLFAAIGTTGSADGVANAAQFWNPRSVRVDPRGNVIVLDSSNHRIRMIQTPTTSLGDNPAYGKFIVPRTSTADNTVQTNGYLARYVRVRPSLWLGDGYFGVAQVVVNDLSGTNVALNKPVYGTSSSDARFAVPSSLTNGTSMTPGTFVFGNDASVNKTMWYAASGNRAAEFLEIDLGAPVPISNVRVIQGANTTSANTGGGGDRTSQTRIELSPVSNSAAALASFTATNAAKMMVTTFAGSTAGYMDGPGLTAQFSIPSDTVFDSTGNAYLVDRSNRCVRKITPQGIVSTLAGSTVSGAADGVGMAASFTDPVSAAIDSGNNLYVSDYGAKKIRRITTTGSAPGTVTTLTTSAPLSGPTGCVFDSAGTIYVMDYAANKIMKLTLSGTTYTATVLAGSGAVGSADGTGAAATFNAAYGIAIHPTTGNLYVSGASEHKIRMITPSGIVTTVAGTGAPGYVDAQGVSAAFNTPFGLVFDRIGNLYIADGLNHCIRIMYPSGYVGTLAGRSGVVTGWMDGIANATQFNQPRGISIDSLGNLFVADALNQRVRMIQTPTLSLGANPRYGRFMVPFGAPADTTVPINNYVGRYIRFRVSLNHGHGWLGLTQVMVNDANGKNLALNRPVFASSSNTGNTAPPASVVNGTSLTPGNRVNSDWWIAGSGNRAAEFFEIDLGAPQAIANIRIIGGHNTISTNAQYDSMSQMRIEINQTSDPAPMTSYALTMAQRMRVVTFAGTAGMGGAAAAAGNTNGVAASARFKVPYGSAIDSKGNIYVSEWENHLIRKITPSGMVSTFAGSGTAGLTDGTGTAAAFNNPRRITIDSTDTIYVADTSNKAIRMITPAGVVTTIDRTSFEGPHDCALDLSGNLYVVDGRRSCVYKITRSPPLARARAASPAASRASSPASGASVQRGGGLVELQADLAAKRQEYNSAMQRLDEARRNLARSVQPQEKQYFQMEVMTGQQNVTAAGEALQRAQLAVTAEEAAVAARAAEAPRQAEASRQAAEAPRQAEASRQAAAAASAVAASAAAASPEARAAEAARQTASAAAASARQSASAASASSATALSVLASAATASAAALVTWRTTLLAGSGTRGTTNGIGAAASFSAPDGIAVHPITGDVYIGGNLEHRIRKITGNVVTTFAGTGGGRRVDGPVATAEFNYPCGLAFDSVGNLYVGDVENHCIRVINTGGYVQTFAGSSTPSSIDGFANVATFNRPPQMAFDSGGNMVVIEGTGNLVRMIQTPELSALSPLGHNPLYGKFLVPKDSRTADNTVQTNGFIGRYIRFRASTNIGDGFLVIGQAIVNDKNGTNIALGKPAYQTSTYSAVLPVACITNGTTTIKDWPQVACSGYDATLGTRRNAEFFEIDLGAETAISSLRVFGLPGHTSTSTNDRVSYMRIEINSSTDSSAATTSYAATIAAQPGLAAKATEAATLKQSMKTLTLAGSASGYADGPAAQALFNSPTGVVQDAQGNTYVCDQMNNVIRKITVSGVVSTFAGSGTAGSVDGTLTAAQFNQPVGISVDSRNNLYVNEYTGFALRKITPEGVVTSLDKTSLAISYSSKVDSLGNIYVVDCANHCITIPTPQPRPKGIPVGAVGTFTGTGMGGQTVPIAAVNVTDTGVLVFMVNDGGLTKMIANDTPNTAKSYTGPITAYDPARWPSYTSAGVKTTGTYVLNLTSLIYPTIAGFISGVASTGIIRITTTNVTNSTNAAEIMSGQNLVAIGYDSAANKTVMIANDAVGTAKWYTGPISAYSPAKWPEYNSGGVKTNGNYILLPVAAGNFTGTNITGTIPIASVNVTNSNDAALVSSGKNLVFMVFDDGYTKMVANDDVGTAKFYAGPISDYNPARWPSYTSNGVKTDRRYVVNLTSLTYPSVTGIPRTTYAGVRGTNGYVNGPMATAQFSYPTDMAIHPVTGDMYIADSGNHMIRLISRGAVSAYAGTGANVSIDGPIYCPDSTPTAIRSFASFSAPYGLAFDAKGENLYVCEQTGQAVRVINMASGYVSTCAGTGAQGLTDGAGTQTSFNWLQGIALDKGNNIILGDKGNNRVRMIQTVATQIGSMPYLGKFIVPTASSGADNTVLTNAYVGRYIRIRPSTSLGDGCLYLSQVIVIDSTGRNIALGKPVYATATVNGAPSASMVTNGMCLFPGSDTFGAAPNGSAWYSAGRNDYLEIDLGTPVAITSVRLIQGANFTNAAANDRTSQTRIEINTTTDAAATASYTATLSRQSDEAKVHASGALMTELTLKVVTYGGDGTSDSVDGSLETAQFSNPAGIEMDSTGNLFVVDFNTNVIRKITPDGTVTTFAGSGAAETTDGTGTAAAFNSPYGLAIDSVNNLYVTEIAGNALRKITPSGVVTTLEDKGLNYPYDCAVDSKGNVYVVDSYNHRITVQAPGGKTTNFAGVSGKLGYKDGPAATALFNNPCGIAIHPTTGDIYIGGGRDACVRVIKRGQVSTYAGSGRAGYVDGPRYSAQFSNPYGLTFDPQGNLYVVENINAGRVRRVNTAGFVETVAGSSSPFFDGIANVAGFSFPTYMTISKEGDIFVSDLNNNRIRMIQTPQYQKSASSAVAQRASSAVARGASSAMVQAASSAVAWGASSAQERSASSAVAQAASSAMVQAASSAQERSASSARASSAKAEMEAILAWQKEQVRKILEQKSIASGARRASSAVAQAASSAQERSASSAVAQAASSAQERSASSAVAQQASSAQERSASSAVAQQASSAVAQTASSALVQQASSAVAQTASSALQQQASSAVAQQASSAVAQTASSALVQRASSAVAQTASSALQQQASSAVAQTASSAVAQQASSALVQRASSAVAQAASSAVEQTASSAQQQFASSAKLQAFNLASSISLADSVKLALTQSQSAVMAAIASGKATPSILQGLLATVAQQRANLLVSGRAILKYNPNYQDPTLQTVIPDNTLSALGVTRVYDALRNKHIFLDSKKNIISNPITPLSRAYTSGAQRGGKRGSRKAGVLMYRV